MNIEELREYNRLVVEASKEVSKPWKYTTFILSLLLGCMISLYFLCPAEIVIDQDNIGTENTNNTGEP